MPSLLERDAQLLWHPASHFCDAEILPPKIITGARGSWLFPEQGPDILDAISSWWTCIHGHGCPELVQVLHRQAQTLDHVMFAGFSHEPAIELASELLDAAPPHFERVFFSDCGSASVEVALKIAFQYHAQSNAPQRRRFCALDNSYHGETLGALSVCSPSAYRGTFASLLPSTLFLPSPHQPEFTWHSGKTESPELSVEEARALEQSEKMFRESGQDLAALIVEPLVQCAGKFRMHSPQYLTELCTLARKYGILIILDEIAVGFGRCEPLFASQLSGVEADFMCLSKGLSGGIMPLAATLIREGISQAFEGEPSRSFLHSHTFCGNPLACALGVKSLQLLRSPQAQTTRAHLAQSLESAAQRLCAESPHVLRYRQCGTIVAFDLETRGHPRPGRAIRGAALEQGLLLRPLHDVLYWMPPYCLSEEELGHLKEKSLVALDEALRDA